MAETTKEPTKTAEYPKIEDWYEITEGYKKRLGRNGWQLTRCETRINNDEREEGVILQYLTDKGTVWEEERNRHRRVVRFRPMEEVALFYRYSDGEEALYA